MTERERERERERSENPPPRGYVTRRRSASGSADTRRVSVGDRQSMTDCCVAEVLTRVM